MCPYLDKVSKRINGRQGVARDRQQRAVIGLKIFSLSVRMLLMEPLKKSWVALLVARRFSNRPKILSIFQSIAKLSLLLPYLKPCSEIVRNVFYIPVSGTY